MEMEKQTQPPAYASSPTPGQPAGPPPAQGYVQQQQPGMMPPQQQQQFVQPGYIQQPGIQQPQMAYQQPMHGQPMPGQPMQAPQQMVYQQQTMPQQAIGVPGQGTIYQNAMPVATLGPTPAPIDCPSCHQRSVTNIMHTSGDCTHLWALGFCIFVCLPCIPYLIESFKDVQHKCGKCGVTVATFKRSGGTQVHVFS